MKFYTLATEIRDTQALENDYKNGREIGIIRVGENALFFRKKLKKYYIPYSDITRAFRRVMSVPAKLCCGKGEFVIENLVVYTGDTEIAQIQLPGTKAARILMDDLKAKVPEAQFSRPDESRDTAKEK